MRAEVLAAMRAHAERAWPEECVGAVLSDGAVLPLQNVANDRRSSFLVSARESLEVERAAEAKGLNVLGFYHSHPDGPAVPSASDADQASEGRWTFIVQVLDGVAATPRAFFFEHGEFAEDPGLPERVDRNSELAHSGLPERSRGGFVSCEFGQLQKGLVSRLRAGPRGSIPFSGHSARGERP
jgi:proteasome lid subunit RPN8/RPN11